MKKAFLIWAFLLICILQGTTIIVDIEGAGNYLSIQEGINASTNGDTVLVYPGRYYENIDYNGKEITVASLELTTGNRDYVHNTIIDGNQNSCCVALHNNEGEGTILRGFTITNGIGYQDPYGRFGGGIYSYETSFSLINCLIEQNRGIIGGGIFIDGGNVYLEGNTIRCNTADMYGGGLMSCHLTSYITFSEDNRNNFYYNIAITGNDIYNSIDDNGLLTDVVVDTFTVTEPFGYEFYQGEGNCENQSYDTRFEMLHSKRERVYTDMYISPDGNDENSGVTPEEPLQTINQALHFITADEDNPLTIHLENGVYSTELNNQIFPVILRSHVSIIGESVENTIIELDGIDQSFAIDLMSDLGYEIKNLTITNGYANGMTNLWARIINIDNTSSSVNPILLENLRILDNQYMQLFMISTANATMRNIIFENNIYYPTSDILRNYMNNHGFDCTVLMENCISKNNHAGGLCLDSAGTNQGAHNFNIVNCEFSDNEFHNNYTDYTVGISVFCIDKYNLNVINSTFAGNVFDGVYVENAPLRLAYDIEAEIMNTIIYDNETAYSIILRGNNTLGIPVVDVHHSIIEDGIDGVYIEGFGILNWDEDTISEEDPLFMYEGEYPYKLQEGSLAIDAGSLELPEGVVLPEYDLAGNLRIRGNGIDIGAYEYNPFSNPVHEDELEYSNLNYYPNPVRISEGRGAVIINYTGLMQVEDYQIGIYNIKGQKVWGSELKRGYSGIRWDCCNDNGDKVAAGVYFLRLSKDGEYLEQGKLTVVK
ncbi:MAG: choice-of-anchor Q domain-containing protein [Candidatus Stygibacter australis]|nr:choice-of-anchor Q domain-containing protein [Candidatus Stygibacter australis]